MLILITFVTSIPAALLLYAPVLDDANYVIGAGADTGVALGAFLEVLLIIAISLLLGPGFIAGPVPTPHAVPTPWPRRCRSWRVVVRRRP